MKNKNLLLMLENHIDKIVLAVFVLISLFLLWVYVIGNPYGEKVRIGGREKKYSPSEIDQYVKEEAEDMLPKLNLPAKIEPYNRTYASDYDRLLRCPISEISSIQIPHPSVGDVVVEEKRLYALPEIPALTDMAVESLRGAAQMPAEEVTPNRPYASVRGDVEDIDFVSVSARFDVQKLYNNFQQSFMGRRLLKTSWQDSQLAAPVFARMDLQRRAKQNGDEWGPWMSVSRTNIDSYRKLLEELPLTLDQSQYGVNILLPRYKKQDIQNDILQPEYYSFIISRLDWMPPEFLAEARELLEAQEEKERRERLEQRRDQNTRTSETRRTTTTRRQPGARRQPGTGRRGDRTPMGEMGLGPITAPRTPVRKERKVEDVQKDFEKERLDEKSKIETIREPLLVWAHDDTTEPGQTYQYRLRIGVFNPIAGKDWFEKDQAEYKDQIVLWSEYSEPTEELHVPKRAYVFPMEVIANEDASNDIEGVKVEVAKYYLGQWRDFEFDVYHGQIIGYEVEDVEEKSTEQNQMDAFQPVMTEMGTELKPDKIDFTTDITFVDVAKETAWGSRNRLRRSVLYKMLYYDTGALQQMPIGKSQWDSVTRKMYAEIQESMEQDVLRRSPATMPGMMPGMMPEMVPGMDQDGAAPLFF